MEVAALAVMYVAGIASGTYLVITEHYGWAWVPFMLICCISYSSDKDTK